ncbi:sigma-70 family RNA polymerase sigma factor [Streptosporangium lutulentum]
MAAERFEEHRALLTGVAYRVLGTLADAEDVVQEAWLRWTGVDASTVEDDRAYLIKVTTRLSIDRLRRVRAQRESYVGPWLPELVGTTPDVAEHVELSASVELALLVVLETLSPLERAVFVLREAFALPYAEIGEIIGRSELGDPAARPAGQGTRPGAQAEVRRGPGRAAQADRAIRRRGRGGDLEALTAMLSADASLVGDGGGRVSAPLRVIAGADKVARFLISIGGQEGTRKFMRAAGADPASGFAVGFADVNGGPAAVMTADGRPIAVFSLVVGDGLIEAVFLVANPEKMSRL